MWVLHKFRAIYKVSNMGKAAPKFFLVRGAVSCEVPATVTWMQWRIGNKLHWTFDVTKKEDASQLRKDYMPQNLSLLLKIALNIIHATSPLERKTSLRLGQKGGAWDDTSRMGLLGIMPLLWASAEALR